MAVNRHSGEVVRAQRAFRAIAARDPMGHKRLRELLKAGNQYAEAGLRARGSYYDRRLGGIVSLADRDRAARLTPPERVARERAAGMDV